TRRTWTWRLTRFSLPYGEGSSREHPVQEPGRRGRCAVKPRAEQPEPAAGLILDAEIIARAAALLGPPGAFDAFRTFDGDDFVERAAPAKPHRRPVGHRGDRLDRLRFHEQARRTQCEVSGEAKRAERRPTVLGARGRLRGKAQCGKLRQMRILRKNSRDAV